MASKVQPMLGQNCKTQNETGEGRAVRTCLRTNNSQMNTNFAAMVLLAFLSVFGSLAMPPAKAEAGLVVSLDNIEANRQLSNDPKFQWAAAISNLGSTGLRFASAIAIAPDVYINSGHFTPRNGSLVAAHKELVFDRNYNTSTSRYDVARTERYPGFVFGDTSTVDLGVGWTSTFIQLHFRQKVLLVFDRGGPARSRLCGKA